MAAGALTDPGCLLGVDHRIGLLIVRIGARRPANRGGIKMTVFYKGVLWITYLLMFFGTLAASIQCNDYVREEKKKESERYGDRNYEDRYLRPVGNRTYATECGACHFAYQPELLPSGSWRKILADLEHHFGEEVIIGTDSKNEINRYLLSNSAETSSAKLAVKIMKDLGDRTPLRITDIVYIRKKHHEILPRILKQEVGVGSLSNCQACHRTA
jgi:hypothetical protein